MSEPGPAVNPVEVADARAWLEAFVVDNDDLRLLEERLGRFNIFDALHIAKSVTRVGRFSGKL